MFDFLGDLAWAALAAWVLKTLPGWLMLMLAGLLAFAIAWKHRDASDYRYSIAYFQDATFTIVILVLTGVGLAVLVGWLGVG